MTKHQFFPACPPFVNTVYDVDFRSKYGDHTIKLLCCLLAAASVHDVEVGVFPKFKTEER